MSFKDKFVPIVFRSNNTYSSWSLYTHYVVSLLNLSSSFYFLAFPWDYLTSIHSLLWFKGTIWHLLHDLAVWYSEELSTSSPILAPNTNFEQGIQHIDGYSLCYLHRWVFTVLFLVFVKARLPQKLIPSLSIFYRYLCRTPSCMLSFKTIFYAHFVPDLVFLCVIQSAWNAKYFLILLIRKNLSCVQPKKWT